MNEQFERGKKRMTLRWHMVPQKRLDMPKEDILCLLI
jgi:hypothetical protein